MNFIEASKILRNQPGGTPLKMHLSASGNVEPLLLFLRAAGALRGKDISIQTLPFGTLGQALLSPLAGEGREAIIILPWDLVPECDWRSGIPAQPADPYTLLANAKTVADRLARRKNCRIFFLPAAVPPLFINERQEMVMSAGLSGLMADAGSVLLTPEIFSLSNYLSSGVPFAGSQMGLLAETIAGELFREEATSSKVLITDLDNVFWSGLAAEEGVEGISCGPEGKGFRHFLYQGLLLRLKNAGILLAAVSRNDLAVAKAPIVAGKTIVSEADFIAILASYEPKSVHIRRLAQQLNLGIDSFVFVDDNPIEIAEVSAALPQIKCLQFPLHDDELPGFVKTITQLFKRDSIGEEDKQRTEMYRRRMETTELVPVDAAGGDLRDFLAGLQMQLTLFNRNNSNRERAIQLINKTNQFNLNGIRRSPEEVEAMISEGGRLLTAKLDDRTGTHGEIMVCLIDKHNCVQSLVLSCRVFQRMIEFVLFCKLLKFTGSSITLAYQPTEKNTPIGEFLKDPAFEKAANGQVILHGEQFMSAHAGKIDIFKIEEVGFD